MNVNEEILKIGLTKTEKFQSFSCNIEKKIYYNTIQERDSIVRELYALCRKYITEQMIIDGLKSKNDIVDGYLCESCNNIYSENLCEKCNNNNLTKIKGVKKI